MQNTRQEKNLPDSHAQYLKKLKDKGAFLIGYAGAHGHANALHTAIQAMKQVNDSIHLICIGQGNQKDSLIDLAAKNDLRHKVHFLEPIDHAQISNFLLKIDAAYIGLLKSPLFRYGASPAKMNDYMMAAKPIIYAVGDPQNPVELSGCGISCRAEDSDQITQAMNSLATMNDTALQEMGAKGHKWLMGNQTVEKQVNMILEKLNTQ
jgi:hypothetical protein